ncbi:MAG TPA: phospholipid carrier-dependent glycosyltransferase [Patescibacteria group bacterium]|nr:phospholipid carrier-dependent glycosyltransferase [Patescibacteria group bacterium]
MARNSDHAPISMFKKYLPIILILLLAFTLRTYKLTEVPPGLTHDEANHGRDSINILDGVLLFYFPLNYGSEPLYNYIVAGVMATVGENLFALRLVNGMFGVLAIAALYLWASWTFKRRTALITAALMAVSFWPLATSRQALRAGLLPFLIAVAVLFFWQIYRWASHYKSDGSHGLFRPKWWLVAGFAVSVAATLHNYLAARVLWLIFPTFLVYLVIIHRSIFRAIWRPTAAGLVGAGILVIPMFVYVQAHPEAETRLQMLDGSLDNLIAGRLTSILENIGEGLLAFIRPGFGDHFLAYNIPGRPVLGLVTAVFFLLGLLLALWRWRQAGYAFLLIWFAFGILPSLITGPEANTTRNVGALPPTYVFPAIGFVFLAQLAIGRWGRPARVASAGVAILWLLLTLFMVGRDYFSIWAQSPDVRAAYQHTLTQGLGYLLENPVSKPQVVSSVYPGAAHDPSIARVLLPDGGNNLRWIDARYSLLLPEGQSARLLVPSSTPLHPAFNALVQTIEVVGIRPDDLDPSFTLYQVDAGQLSAGALSYNFGDGLVLLDAYWLNDSVQPGEVNEMATLWQVIDPALVGPVVPPAFETDVVLFTHVLDENGNILAQQDALQAPSWDWQTGDLFIQIHRLQIPAGTRPGAYQVVVGLYDRASGKRLPLLDEAGAIVDSSAPVVPLIVDE